jgi:hypothetical protein
MTVEHVELLVEEPSMEAALRLLLPRILGELSFEVYPYGGSRRPGASWSWSTVTMTTARS